MVEEVFRTSVTGTLSESISELRLHASGMGCLKRICQPCEK